MTRKVIHVLDYQPISMIFTKLVKINLFEFTDYHAFLDATLPTSGKERGSRVRLATALGVQKGFVSAVIHGSSELNLEQAFKVSQFLSHTDDEQDYFLLLVQCARAGSKDLEKYFRGKATKIQRRHREIREHIQVKANLSEVDRLTYYSAWHSIAVHMCLRIPGLDTPQAIAVYLGLPVNRVASELEFLVKTGLAQSRGSAYEAGSTRIHLSADSPLIAKHHTNWRMQAIQALDRNREEDLHYSSVMSISREVAEKIRNTLLRSIQEMEPMIRDAKDEGAFVLTMDLFDLKFGGN
jgi:uncharacterized protein (TIGR02147 family)